MEVDGTWHLDKTTLFLHVPHTKQGFALEMSHRWRVTHVPRSLLPRGTTWIGSQGEATLGLFTTWTEVGQEPHYRGPGVFFKPRATWDDLGVKKNRHLQIKDLISTAKGADQPDELGRTRLLKPGATRLSVRGRAKDWSPKRAVTSGWQVG